MKKLKIFILSGEPSGDFLGARLIHALRKKHKHNLVLKGVGGDLMRKEGVHSSFSIDKIAVIGIIELIPKIFAALKLLKATANEIRKFKPDILITIDVPSFSLRLVKMVSDLRSECRTKFVHYVSPTIWAYKSGRINYMENYYDLVLAILPFEPEYYRNTSLTCEYVGHPVSEYGFEKGSSSKFYKKYKIDFNKKILGVMAGSRIGEVKRMLPVFIEAINMFVDSSKLDLIVVFPVVSMEIKGIIESYRDEMKFKSLVVKTSSIQEKVDMFAAFDSALVKSGTSSHELVFANVPMIVAYKANIISYLIAKYFFRILAKIKFITIANILLKKEVVPEYIQDQCNPANLCKALSKLYDKKFRAQQLKEYAKVRKLLSSPTNLTPSENAAKYLSVFSSSYAPKKSDLVEFLQKSLLKGIARNLDRDKSGPRKIEL